MPYSESGGFSYIGRARPFKKHTISFYTHPEHPQTLFFTTCENRGEISTNSGGQIEFRGALIKARAYVISRYMEDRSVLMEKYHAIPPMKIESSK